MKTNFTTYVFDENLNFVSEDTKTFDPNATEGLDELKEKFPWFKYRGETYSRTMINVKQGFKGKLVATKQKITFVWKWNLGIYIPKFEKAEVKSKARDKLSISQRRLMAAIEESTGVLCLVYIDEIGAEIPFKLYEACLLRWLKRKKSGNK